MAPDPFFDKRRGEWAMKYKPDPAKEAKWVRVVPCKHPTPWSADRPPKKSPQAAIDRARELAEIEYRAKHGIGAAPARARGLDAHLDGYIASHALSARANSNVMLGRFVRDFKAFALARGVATVQGVRTAHCREYLEGRAKLVGHSSLRNERGYLSGAWTRAVDDGPIEVNPWRAAKTPGRPKDTAITFWTSAEIGRIAAACRKTWQRDLVPLMATTGLRIRTALRLRWD